NTDALSNYKVIIGGDQLTKVNLQEVRNLRTLAPTDRKKLVDLQPVICELWHLKQDFVETFYHFLLDALIEEVSNEKSLFEVMDLGFTVDDSGVISSTSTLGVPAGTSIPTNLKPSACPPELALSALECSFSLQKREHYEQAFRHGKNLKEKVYETWKHYKQLTKCRQKEHAIFAMDITTSKLTTSVIGCINERRSSYRQRCYELRTIWYEDYVPSDKCK
ncbi:Hypothetical predicted protein, partial [Mytilus galloprovincialis]